MQKILVIAIFTVPIFIFFFFMTWLIDTNTGNSIRLSFGSDSTQIYSILDGKLNFVISDESDKKILHISAVNDKIDINISSSNLFESNSNRTIKSNGITFNDKVLLRLKNLSAANPKNVNVSINKTAYAGLYHGMLNITSQNITSLIPINIDIKVDFDRVAIRIADGIALSVVVWNVIGYYFLDRKQEQSKKQVEGMIEASYRSKDAAILNNLPAIRVSLDEIISKLQNSRVNSARRDLENLKGQHARINSQYNLKNLNTVNDLQGRGLPFYISSYDEILRRLRGEDTKFSLKKYVTTGILEKNIISGFTSIAFGLIVGLIPLLQTDYIINLRIIEWTDALILIGLGVGVGNLNEAISKIWETSKDADDKND